MTYKRDIKRRLPEDDATITIVLRGEDEDREQIDAQADRLEALIDEELEA